MGNHKQNDEAEAEEVYGEDEFLHPDAICLDCGGYKVTHGGVCRDCGSTSFRVG